MSSQEEKRYDPRDSTLILHSNRPDDLDPYSAEEGDLTAELSCGHAVTPQSLTHCCLRPLNEGQYKFRCAALKDGIQRCNAALSYQEVRRLADLTVEEMQHFEENIGRLAAAEFCDFKACPGCESYVERQNLKNLCVQCLVCKADKKKTFQFCWQCLRPWKGAAPRSDRCDNNGCINQDLELLRTCKTTTLPRVRGADCVPSIRACPTCGHKVEHDKTGCKNIICPRCQVEFCFVCLKLTPVCMRTSSYFIPCSDGVAPRQTSIPVWKRK